MSTWDFMPLSQTKKFCGLPKFIPVSEINPFAPEGLIFLQARGTLDIT